MLTGLGRGPLFEWIMGRCGSPSLCAASDLEPANTAPYLFLGKIEKATLLRRCHAASKSWRGLYSSSPGDALANYYYAISIWKREKGSEKPADLKEVETLLEKSIAIDPKLDEAYLQLGVLQFGKGDFEQEAPAISRKRLK